MGTIAKTIRRLNNTTNGFLKMPNVKSYFQKWRAIIVALFSWLVAILLIVDAGFDRVYYESWLGQEYRYPTRGVIIYCATALVETIIFYLILCHFRSLSKVIRLTIILIISAAIAYVSFATFDLPPIYYAHGLWLGLIALATFIIIIFSIFRKPSKKAKH